MVTLSVKLIIYNYLTDDIKDQIDFDFIQDGLG